MSLVTGGAPKEALQAKNPTAEQTAVIRQAYANANLPASESTAVIQNPASAQAVYGNIARASQPQPQQTQETTTVETSIPLIGREESIAYNEYYSSLPVRSGPTASLSRFNQANEGGFRFLTTPRPDVSLSRFNQANEGGYTFAPVTTVPIRLVNQYRQQQELTGSLQDLGASGAQASAYGYEQFLIFRNNPNPLIDIANFFLPRQTRSAIAGASGSLLGPITGQPDLLAGTTQFILSGGRNGSQLQAFRQQGLSYDIANVATTGFTFLALGLAGDAVSNVIRAIGVPSRIAARVATPIVFGTFSGGVTAAAGGSPLQVAESFGLSAGLVGASEIIPFGRIAPRITRGVEDIISPVSQAVRGRPFTFATLRLGTGDVFAPQFEEAQVLIERGPREGARPTIDVAPTVNASDIRLAEQPTGVTDLTNAQIIRPDVQTENALNLRSAQLQTPERIGQSFEGASIVRPEEIPSFSEASLTPPRYTPLREPLTQGELDLLLNPEYKPSLEENPYLRSLSRRTLSDDFEDFAPRRFGTRGGGASTPLKFKPVTRAETETTLLPRSFEDLGPSTPNTLAQGISRNVSRAETLLAPRMFLTPRQRAQEDEDTLLLTTPVGRTAPTSSLFQTPRLNAFQNTRLDQQLFQSQIQNQIQRSELTQSQVQIQRQTQVQAQRQVTVSREDLRSELGLGEIGDIFPTFGGGGFPFLTPVSRNKRKSRKKKKASRRKYKEFFNPIAFERLVIPERLR